MKSIVFVQDTDNYWSLPYSLKYYSTETINAEYSFTIRYPFFNFYDQSEEAKMDFFQFPEVIAKVISFEVQIELCGNWLWISGNTYKYRKELKAAGFFFAPEKCT